MSPAVKHYLHYRGRDRSLGLPGEAKWEEPDFGRMAEVLARPRAQALLKRQNW